MYIRRYLKGDSAEVSRFIKRCFIRDQTDEVRSHEPEYYQWKYESNPWSDPVVWVAEDESGKINGLMAVIPKPIWIQGERVIWGESGDTFINPATKGKNLFADLALHVFDDCRQAGLSVIYGSPNQVSYQVLVQLFGFEPVFTYRSLIRPMRFGGLIYSRLRSRRISDALGWLPDRLHTILYWPAASVHPFSLDHISGADADLDSLWQKISPSLKTSIARDRTYIQWRYFDHPDDYRVMIVRRNQEPAGLAVFKLTSVQRMRCGHIVDLTVPCHPDERPALWNALLTELKKCRVDFVNIWQIDDEAVVGSLCKIGFIPRKKPFWIVKREDPARTGEHLPEDSVSWCFSQSDTDQI